MCSKYARACTFAAHFRYGYDKCAKRRKWEKRNAAGTICRLQDPRKIPATGPRQDRPAQPRGRRPGARAGQVAGVLEEPSAGLHEPAGEPEYLVPVRPRRPCGMPVRPENWPWVTPSVPKAMITPMSQEAPSWLPRRCSSESTVSHRPAWASGTGGGERSPIARSVPRTPHSGSSLRDMITRGMHGHRFRLGPGRAVP
jgi:hypothetical protein